ncbi:Dixin [Geodia barretti]|jgi:hypothetical protein|uniref:Dixin n=1 Tax=Geodia barretti TaxID=519541 RepID=A0AA35STC3_GEOBA|nr:Dixin [Geodia barretti]
MLSEKVVPVEGEPGGLKARLAARFKKRPEESPEKKRQQLQDYTAWVNNYLKRKPGTPLVTDLRWSLGDGVIFVHLVEIVAKAQVAGVERWPSSAEGRRLNTERALEFLRGDGVMLHLDACRDLLEGNVKGVMKVILAIAERYQPKSVKPRTVVPETLRPANHTAPLPDSQYGIRQELVRPYTHPQTPIRPDQIQSSFHSSGLYPSPYPVDPATEGMYSSPIDTLPANKPPQVMYSRCGSANM